MKRFYQDCVGLALLCVTTSFAGFIPQQRLLPFGWVPGSTVGFIGAVPTFTNVVNVVTDLGCDTNGIGDCSTNIIDYVYGHGTSSDLWTQFDFPPGNYRVLTYPLSGAQKRGVVFNGSGPGKSYINVLRGNGFYQTGSIASGTTQTIVSGATRGSTNLVLSGSGFSSGDIVAIVQDALPADNPIHEASSGYAGLSAPMTIYNWVTVASGTDITLALPLPDDFTNNPVLVRQTSGYTTTYYGIQNFTVQATNPPTGENYSGAVELLISGVANFWVSNCVFNGTYDNPITIGSPSLCGTFTKVDLLYPTNVAQGNVGMNIRSTATLFQDCIVSWYGIAVEPNGGWGNAWFACYFPIDGWAIDMHDAFENWSLWDHCVGPAGSSVKSSDGYYGSARSWTFWRCAFPNFWMMRWTRSYNIAASVIGWQFAEAPVYIWDAWNATNSYVTATFFMEFPNMGNTLFGSRFTNDAQWTYPGTNYFDYYANGLASYTPFTFTNTQGPTNVLYGNFSGFHIGNRRPTFVFQDNVNTNLYHGNAYGLACSVSNSVQENEWLTNVLTLNDVITVSNGWTIYAGGQAGYQDMNASDGLTHLITNNWDDYHLSFYGNSNQTMEASVIYATAPAWWGTNRWPAIDPLASTMIAPIPAQLRYAGIDSGTGDIPPPDFGIGGVRLLLNGGPIMTVTNAP